MGNATYEQLLKDVEILNDACGKLIEFAEGLQKLAGAVLQDLEEAE